MKASTKDYGLQFAIKLNQQTILLTFRFEAEFVNALSLRFPCILCLKDGHSR